MPTILTHAALAIGLGRLFTARKMPLAFWGIAASLAMLPDIDVYAFRFGIPYGAFLGHRGFSHSLSFAAIAGFLAATTYRYFALRFWDLLNFFFVAAASHGILDAFTNGGLGVAFFAPFDNSRTSFRGGRYRFPPSVPRSSPVLGSQPSGPSCSGFGCRRPAWCLPSRSFAGEECPEKTKAEGVIFG